MAKEKTIEIENQLVGFRLGEEEFGLDIMKVQEIIKVPEITRVPQAPDFVEGVINLRGDVLPVINSRKRFGLEEVEKEDSTRIMVVNLAGASTGLVVDSVSEVLRLEKEQIEPPPPVIRGVESRFLRGVGKLNDGKKLIMLLDTDHIFVKEEREQVSQVSNSASSTAKSADEKTEMVDEIQLVSFGLAGEEYAVEVMNVQEIIRVPEITKVPSAPSFIEGVINLREKIIPIINLRERFAFGAIEKTDATRILIVNVSGLITGITVDSVSEVLRVPKSIIDPPPPIISGAEEEYIKGVARLDGGKKLLLLLNAENALNGSEKKELSKLTKGDDAKKEEKKTDSVDERQLVSFKVQDEEFGIDIMQVQEIIRMTEITQVPKAPYFVKGVLNLRGGVLPIIDLRTRFDLEEIKHTESNRILVVNVKDKTMGIIVDSVSEVLRLPKDTIEPPPPIVSGIRAQFLEGVGKLDDGKRLIILLNVDKIFKVSKEEEQAHFKMAEAEIQEKAKAEVEVEEKKAEVEVEEKSQTEVKTEKIKDEARETKEEIKEETAKKLVRAEIKEKTKKP